MKQPRLTCCAARRAPLLSPGFDSYQGDLQSAFRVEAGALLGDGGHFASVNLTSWPVIGMRPTAPVLPKTSCGLCGWGRRLLTDGAVDAAASSVILMALKAGSQRRLGAPARCRHTPLTTTISLDGCPAVLRRRRVFVLVHHGDRNLPIPFRELSPGRRDMRQAHSRAPKKRHHRMREVHHLCSNDVGMLTSERRQEPGCGSAASRG